MRLLEHEAKTLLKASAVPVPTGTIIASSTNSDAITTPIVFKSQVPIGGRGKLGGVVVVENAADIGSTIRRLLSLRIKDYLPHVLLAEEMLAIRAEHYLSLFVDRDSETIRLMAHKNGGIEVENNKSDDFYMASINDIALAAHASQLAAYLGYDIALITPLLTNLYDAFVRNDATLLEINPLVFTADGNLVCGDCKMELDDAAGFRHSEWKFEDTPSDTNFVTLDESGTIATIANGAGLAMATVDAVAASGMKPANFLDIGGGANTESVLKAFRRIAAFPNIHAIVINIFAGITRCDEVAKAIIAAKKQIDGLPPLFIRLAGTNFEAAVALLSEERIPTLATLEECLTAAKESRA